MDWAVKFLLKLTVAGAISWLWVQRHPWISVCEMVDLDLSRGRLPWRSCLVWLLKVWLILAALAVLAINDDADWWVHV